MDTKGSGKAPPPSKHTNRGESEVTVSRVLQYGIRGTNTTPKQVGGGKIAPIGEREKDPHEAIQTWYQSAGKKTQNKKISSQVRDGSMRGRDIVFNSNSSNSEEEKEENSRTQVGGDIFRAVVGPVAGGPGHKNDKNAKPRSRFFSTLYKKFRDEYIRTIMPLGNDNE